MELIDAIRRCIESSANTNATGVTLSETHGWRLTFTPQDRERGAVFIISKDSLNDWLDEADWTAETFEQCDEWIRDNIGDWLYRQIDCGYLTSEDARKLLEHV